MCADVPRDVVNGADRGAAFNTPRSRKENSPMAKKKATRKATRKAATKKVGKKKAARRKKA
jgi:hypothetical protein